MSIGFVAAGAVAVGSVYSANKAAKAQGKATEAASEAASEQAGIAREELEFYKQQYADLKPQTMRAADLANEVSTAQLASMRQNDVISKNYWDYQTNTFRPMERAIVESAQNYDTDARREQKAGQAMADVQQQMDAAQSQQLRGMTRMGVNPNDGKFASMRNMTSMTGALGKAQAASKAREGVELQGYARKMDAASLGRGLASNQATSAGVAINAGNSATANAGVPISQGAQMTNMMGNGYNSALGNLSTANTMMNTANQNSANLWSNASNSLLSAGGTMAGAFFGKKQS